MKIYAFEQVDAALGILPMAARRALDQLGIKLTLEEFRSLTLEDRKELTRAGGLDRIDLEPLRAWLLERKPSAQRIEVIPDPPADHVPTEISSRLDPSRAIPVGTWPLLTPLDRYSILKAARSKDPSRLNLALGEILGASLLSSHLDRAGHVRMVSVTGKSSSSRMARAESWVTMSPAAFERLSAGDAAKGNVLSVARIAGIMAAKKTPDWIPLCHPIALTKAEVQLILKPEQSQVQVIAEVETEGPTGVEMEALTSVSAAALTIYDMLKSIDRAMTLGPARLLEKRGGKSGHLIADNAPAAAEKK